MTQTIVAELDGALGVGNRGIVTVSGDYEHRVVYVRANRAKKSRIGDFVDAVENHDEFPRISEAPYIGDWFEVSRKVGIIQGAYYLISTQALDC